MSTTHRIWTLSLFPEYFAPLENCGVVGGALRGERGEVKFEMKHLNIRDYSPNKYGSVDDYPFGGGAGMIMRPDILEAALVEGVFSSRRDDNPKDVFEVVFPCPRGQVWDNVIARNCAQKWWGETPRDVVFICGRYEGIDERFLEKYVDSYYSLGDFILSGGELATMAFLDSALRFAPGVLGNKVSSADDSFEEGLLEGPQYTRPREFAGVGVPDVLLSGNHKKIEEYKKLSRQETTKKYRPDLWSKIEEE